MNASGAEREIYSAEVRRQLKNDMTGSIAPATKPQDIIRSNRKQYELIAVVGHDMKTQHMIPNVERTVKYYEILRKHTPYICHLPARHNKHESQHDRHASVQLPKYTPIVKYTIQN